MNASRRTPLQQPTQLTPLTHWSVDDSGKLTTAVIRYLHHPANRFRISPSFFQGGSTPSGIHRYGRMYVLHGCIAIVDEAIHVDATAPCYFDFPPGRYQLSVPLDSDAVIVNVFPLPKAAWDSNQPQNQDRPNIKPPG